MSGNQPDTPQGTLGVRLPVRSRRHVVWKVNSKTFQKGQAMGVSWGRHGCLQCSCELLACLTPPPPHPQNVRLDDAPGAHVKAVRVFSESSIVYVDSGHPAVARQYHSRTVTAMIVSLSSRGHAETHLRPICYIKWLLVIFSQLKRTQTYMKQILGTVIDVKRSVGVSHRLGSPSRRSVSESRILRTFESARYLLAGVGLRELFGNTRRKSSDVIPNRTRETPSWSLKRCTDGLPLIHPSTCLLYPSDSPPTVTKLGVVSANQKPLGSKFRADSTRYGRCCASGGSAGVFPTWSGRQDVNSRDFASTVGQTIHFRFTLFL